MNKTLIGVLVSVVVLGAIAGGGYYFYSKGVSRVPLDGAKNEKKTQSACDQSTAKVGYKLFLDGESNKYCFQYPETWGYSVETNGYNDQGPYVIVFTTKRTEPEKYPFVSVRENWSVMKESARVKAEGSTIKSTTEVSVGAYTATKIVYTGAIGLDFQKTIIVDGTTAYIFDSIVGDVDFDKVAASLTF